MNLRTIAISILFLLAAAACGGSDGDTSSSGVAATNNSESTNTAPADAAPVVDLVDIEDVVDDAIESGEEFAEDLVESLEDAQDVAGGGSMTLTVGDESWTFEPALCAFGPEEIGQEGAEFVLSSIQDGKQMYVSIGVFGHSVSLHDVEDFENPSISLDSFGYEEFISLDGKSFSGSAEFTDGTTDSFVTIPGTFSGTCP